MEHFNKMCSTVSVGERDCQRGGAVVQHTGKQSPSHSNDEAEDTFPQAEWLECHLPLPTAPNPMFSTSIFHKSEK